MKKILAILVLGIASMTSFAEATFDQIQGLIEQQNYSAAEKGLEEIISNHPKSAKAFYAMAQAQAGLGNQEKAKKALDIATGLNPTLDFAPQSSVASLREAITPQVKKIEAVEPSHWGRNFILGFVLFFGIGMMWYMFQEMKRKAEKDAERQANAQAEAERRAQARAERDARWETARAELATKMAEERAKLEAEEAALKAHKNYGHERFDPANPDKLKSVKQFNEEKAEKARVEAEAEARRQRIRAEAAEDDARRERARANYSTSAPTHTTVVNNSSNDMLTGMMIGNMMGSSHHDHDTTIIREREVVREQAPAVAPRSSWDDIGNDTPKSSSRSSSWDDTPSTSSSRSSSWDDDSSSSRSSSSWSSSSSSDSSSSWSSSDSSSSSSSSWD